LGIAIVIGLIVVLRVNAFLALVAAALAVSLLAPLPAGQPMGVKMTRVLEALGTLTGKIGVLIAAAAIIGECMMLSGAADRVVRFFLRLLGEKRGDVALNASGFVLGIPVFFDTVFYLLSPLARSMYRRTNSNFLLYVMAIAAGGACTHTLVPPTPGPLATAAQLGVGLDKMILVGALVGLPATIAGMCYARWLNKRMPIPLRPLPGETEEAKPLRDDELPGILPAIAPILLPVLMISADTIAQALAKPKDAPEVWKDIASWTSFIGNPTFALLVAAVIAIAVYKLGRKPTGKEMNKAIETSLMSAGVIILITAAGGAFGDMLKAAQVGPAIEALFKTGEGRMSGTMLMLMAFSVASVFKIAQGSSTVAMIAAAGMVSALVDPATLGFHPVYLATAIACGSLVVSWMNDSGFWVYTKMSGFTEAEGLKSWSVLLAILGITGLLVTLLLSRIMPMAP
jgi:GntP family gluconate:H+ symporter